jgi:hypothetical protein
MIGSRGLSFDIRPLLDEERVIPAQPAAVRARALARARAALAAGRVAPAEAPLPTPARSPWMTSVALACAISAAVNVAAYQIHAHFARPDASVAPPAAPTRATVLTVTKAPSTQASVAPIDEALLASPVIPPPRVRRASIDRSELRLLSRARAAVARADFAAALPPIAEHARRFRDGRLAEEREALRVGALAGLGRDEEARHAATAFRTRFPHSVLVPAVNQLSAAVR